MKFRIIFLLSSLLFLVSSCSVGEESDDYAVRHFTGDYHVLWLGTSIPHGCTYPKYACTQLNLDCINHAVGGSFLCLPQADAEIHNNTGLSLSATKSEIECTFRLWMKTGEVSQSQMDWWRQNSYESLLLSVLPYVDAVVIDHGYNDAATIIDEAAQGYDRIDWTSTDRSTFIGAFNYLYGIIHERYPDIVVCIGGYFQSSCSFGYTARGTAVATLSEWIARHYDLPLLDAWNYTGIPDGFAPASAGYLDALNTQYGTSFTPVWQDAEGNITYFQQFCPDGVHPFSDPTGHSDEVLNEVFTRLLRERLLPRLDGR